MPTSRPRYMITESDELAEALERAAKLWPELADERGSLLRKIVDLGVDDLDKRANANLQKRKQAILKVAGSLSGVWPKNWRDELRDEWPE